MVAREGQRTGREVTGDGIGRQDGSEVAGVEPDGELVRNEARPALGPALGFHGALDSSQDLHGLEAGLEQPGAGSLDEALEEALHA